MRPSAYNKLRTGNRPDVPLPATGAANQPPAAPTGRPYGERKALLESQQQVPLARQGTPQAAGSGTPTADPAAIEAAFAAMSFPDGKLNDPTTRPGEPVTAGLGSFQPPPTAEYPDNAQAQILHLASMSDNAALRQLADYVASGRA